MKNQAYLGRQQRSCGEHARIMFILSTWSRWARYMGSRTLGVMARIKPATTARAVVGEAGTHVSMRARSSTGCLGHHAGASCSQMPYRRMRAAKTASSHCVLSHSSLCSCCSCSAYALRNLSLCMPTSATNITSVAGIPIQTARSSSTFRFWWSWNIYPPLPAPFLYCGKRAAACGRRTLGCLPI